MEERKPSEYSTINIQSMIDAWPQITAYLREHKNLYHHLTNIVIKGTSYENPKKAQRETMLAMTNAYGPGHFVAKKDRDVIDQSSHPECNESTLKLGDFS